MISIYLPLAVDITQQPLPVQKQLAVAFVKAARNKIRKAILIGWPLLLVRHEKSGGYIIFDETLNIETKLQFIILQDYEKIVDDISKKSNEIEIVNSLKTFRWKDIKGFQEEIYRGLVTLDMSSIFSYGSPELPVQILDKNISDYDIDTEVQDLNNKEDTLQRNINYIKDVEDKITTIINIIKGKRAEERKRVEENYNELINEKQNLLQKTLNETKKNLENDLLAEANKLYSKMTNIEILIGKAELDYEADPNLQKDLENLISLRQKYLSEIQSKLNEIKNKYKIEIRNIVHEIEGLKVQKQKELENIDSKIKELDEILRNIINQLESVKERCQQELNYIRMFYKRAPYDKDKVEVILPFLVSIDANNTINVISPQIYHSNRRPTVFGFFKKDPIEISDNLLNIDLSIFINNIISNNYINKFNDNIRNTQIRGLIEQGLNELYNEGWAVRKSLDEYYI